MYHEFLESVSSISRNHPITWRFADLAPDATAPDDARRWQLATRRAFQWYLTNGYRVERFQYVNDARHACYLLTRDASDRPA